MRAILAALIWLACASGAWAQPALDGSNWAGSATGGSSATFNIASSATAAVYVFNWWGDGITTPPTISGCGLTWTSRHSAVWGGGYVAVWEATTSGALSSCAVTTSQAGGSQLQYYWAAFTGVSAAVFDSNFPSAAISSNGVGTSVTGPTLTTAQAHDLIVTFNINAFGTPNFPCLPSGSGFTINNITYLLNVGIGGSATGRASTTSTFSSLATSCTNGVSETWRAIYDAITADTPSTGRSRIIQ